MRKLANAFFRGALYTAILSVPLVLWLHKIQVERLQRDVVELQLRLQVIREVLPPSKDFDI